MKKALFVIDMLEGFLREGYSLYCGRDAEKIIPFVRGKIEEFNRRDEPIYFIADNHDPDDEEFKRFPAHCVAGTKEAQVISELWEAAKNKKLIPKKRYSGFHGTTLEAELKQASPEEVDVVGVCTNICVLYTVEELRNRDIATVVYRNGVASFDAGDHEHALKQMKEILGADVR